MSSKNPERPLATIAAEIRALKADTISDIIAIGGLLIEAKDQLRHGQWLPWLQREFGYSARTGQNYMAAQRFAGRYEHVANLKLTLTALYRLADADHRRTSIYTADAIAAILAEAKEKLVGAARADAIAMSLHRQPERKGATSVGPAPISLPLAAASLPRSEVALRDKFAAAVAELQTLSTKPAKNFVGVITPDRLEIVANFVKKVAAP